MLKSRISALIAPCPIAIALALTACGGGSPAPTPPPEPVNRAPVASAGSAQSVVAGTAITLDATASQDPDGDPLTFNWSITSAPAGATAALSAATTSRPSLTPDREGSWTLTVTVSDGRGGQSSASVTLTVSAPPPVTPPTIALDQAEPLSGTVRLSLNGTVQGAVTWYVDLRLVGNGDASGALLWNTAGVSNGEHQVLARIQHATGSAVDVRRTVTVGNSSVNLSATVSGTTGLIQVDVRASSSFGIVRVDTRFDGSDFGSLAQPNACSRFCGSTNDVFRFTVDAARVGSGPHTMAITATDGAGSTRSLTLDVPVSNAPVLTLAAPTDGAFAFGTLRVEGTATSDKPGAVTVTARLNDVTFLNTQASAFLGSYDLTGLAPGAYTLTVRATDASGLATQLQRTVIVAGTSARAYTPVFTLPTGGQLLAAEGNQVLYGTGDGTVLKRDLVANTEVALAGAAAVQYAAGWQLDGGRAVAYGKGPDCVLYCVYLWNATGTQTNLTTPNPYSRASNIGGGWAYDLHPVLRGDVVVWVNDKADGVGRYTVHRLSTGTYTRVDAPAGVNYVGNWAYDFALTTGGVVDFWFWGQTGGEGTSSQFDVFQWRSDTGASTRITQGGSRNVYVQVDGQRAAWQQSPVGGNADNRFALLARPMAGGTVTTLAASASQAVLRDGVLAWVEAPSATALALKASNGSTTATLSQVNTATLLANGSGHVAWGDAGRAYTWKAASGVSTLRVDVTPQQTFLTGGALVFTVGRAVYRVGVE